LWCIFSIAGCSTTPLTREDIKYQLVLTAITAVDWAQSREFEDSGLFYERNIVLGRRPSKDKVDAMIPLGILGQWLVTRQLKPEHRRAWQMFMVGVETTAVYNNYQIGIRVDF
jgi:hypothetical protein